MIYLLLFFEFCKIGLFAIGGGLVALPFLYDISNHYHWFSTQDLTHMIALSSITPGPIGINAATYTGFATAGLFGALFASVSLVFPSFIIACIIAKMMKKYQQSSMLTVFMYFLKPASCALLISCFVDMCKVSIIRLDALYKFSHILSAIEFKSVFLLLLLIFLYFKVKNRPFLTIIFAGIIGLIIF